MLKCDALSMMDISHVQDSVGHLDALDVSYTPVSMMDGTLCYIAHDWTFRSVPVRFVSVRMGYQYLA